MSLVVVVNNICDEPRYQRVWRKELRDVSAGMEMAFMYILVFYIVLLDYQPDNTEVQQLLT